MLQKSKLITLFSFTLFIFSGLFYACEEEPVEPETTSELEISSYTLNEIGNIGLPLANPMGVASDEENLWIIFGEHNASEHQLICYDPNTHETLKSYVYTDLIEELGTGVYGISWDGEGIWISVSGNTNKVVKVNTEDGAIMKTWTTPTYLGPSDLEWDRDILWIGSGTGQIYNLNPATGGSDLKWKYTVHGNERDHGIAVRDDEVWIGDLFNQDVHIYDRITYEHLGYIPNGITNNGKFCFHEGYLTVLSEGGVKFYEIIE